MRLRFFAIPALHPEQAEAALAGFLATHRVVGVDRELVHDGAGSFWAICVTVTSAAAWKSLTTPMSTVDLRRRTSRQRH